MRMLMVAPYFPVPQRSGGQVRVYNILRELSRELPIDLACYAAPTSIPHLDEIRDWGVDVHHIVREPTSRPWLRHLRYAFSSVPFLTVDPDPRLRALVQSLADRNRYDIIQVEFLALAFATPRASRARLFITHHYSASDYYRRVLRVRSKATARFWYELLESIKMPAYERRALRQFHGVFATSSLDRALIARTVPDVASRIVVANNGVDIDAYYPGVSGEPRDPDMVVSTCNFQTAANIDSVLFFIESVWPEVLKRHPSAHYAILGKAPPPEIRKAAEQSPRTTLVGEVPDVRPFFDRAQLSTVTMRAGSGTKIRILSSLAMGVPVVATPLGAEGIDATPDQGLFVADTPQQLASHISSILKNGVSDGMRRAARSFIEEHHTWRGSARKMLAAYAEAAR